MTHLITQTRDEIVGSLNVLNERTTRIEAYSGSFATVDQIQGLTNFIGSTISIFNLRDPTALIVAPIFNRNAPEPSANESSSNIPIQAPNPIVTAPSVKAPSPVTFYKICENHHSITPLYNEWYGIGEFSPVNNPLCYQGGINVLKPITEQRTFGDVI